MKCPNLHFDEETAVWFKSSFSSGSANCVEATHLPVTFRKSSYSGGDNDCVEMADWATGAAMRDTKHRKLGALAFASGEWQAFLGSAKNDRR